MTKINLRDFYPSYTSDFYIDVPDEIATLIYEFELEEAAFHLRTYRHKAFYSLDRGDGLEHEAEEGNLFSVTDRERILPVPSTGRHLWVLVAMWQ